MCACGWCLRRVTKAARLCSARTRDLGVQSLHGPHHIAADIDERDALLADLAASRMVTALKFRRADATAKADNYFTDGESLRLSSGGTLA